MQWEQIEIIESIKSSLTSTSSNVLTKSSEFFQEEISWIKGKLFNSKTEYVEAKRTGRGTSDRVTASDKEVIWNVYLKYNQELKNRGKVDFDDYAVITSYSIHYTKLYEAVFFADTSSVTVGRGVRVDSVDVEGVQAESTNAITNEMIKDFLTIGISKAP